MIEKQKAWQLRNKLSLISSEKWWLLLISGVITLAIGIIIVAWPMENREILVLIFGISLIMLAIVSIIRAFKFKKIIRVWWVLLIDGVVGIITAILFFSWPVHTKEVFAYFFGIWLVIFGILTIIFGISQKNIFSILNGTLPIIVGFLVLFSSPYFVLATLVFMFGIQSIFRGIILIVQSVMLEKPRPVIGAESS